MTAYFRCILFPNDKTTAHETEKRKTISGESETREKSRDDFWYPRAYFSPSQKTA